MQLEAVLEEFEQALRSATEGNLPDAEMFLTGFQGEAREYLEREMAALERDVLRGNYVVLNPLESGGMGAVSKVRHLGLGKVMALKEIRAEALQIGDQTEILRRFRREIEVAGRLAEHPNIVSYTDTGVNDSGAPYLVMDYIDGEDLGKIVRRRGPLAVKDAARVVHDTAIGLAHAHDNGLVHRDVKPSNIMVSRHGTVKVLDFGLARIANTEHHLTALTTGKVMGTFDYMSPELCREMTPDHRGDIYSLGCTFYYLLAGRAPYEESKSQFDKMNAHLHAEPAPIAGLAEHPELQAVLRKMTAKNADDRYQELHEVVDALRPYCEGTDLRRLVRSEKPGLGGDGSPPGGGILLRTDRRHDSPGKITGAAADDPTAEWSGLRKSRRRMVWTTCLVAAGLVLAAALLIADQWQRNARRNDLELVLGTLPGLNGRWWFDETPWLLPEVRRHLAESLSHADEEAKQELLEAIYENPSAPAAYEHLENLAKSYRRQWPKDVTSRLSTFQNLDPEIIDAEAFAEALRSIAQGLDSRPRGSLTGSELHLRAVIHHHLEEFDGAARMYAAADAKYVEEEQHALRSLALLDWAELLHAFRQPVGAQGKFHEAYQPLADSSRSRPLPPLFELYAKAMEADSLRRIDNTAPAEELLDQAWEIAATLPKQHPLRALVLERRGWLHLDQWRLAEAKEDFEAALAIRQSHEPENHRARHFVYWDEQGIAMAQMYAGEARPARQRFLALLGNIGAGDTPKQQRELEDRRPNLYERLADTALFNGPMEAMNADPAAELEAAIQAAKHQNFSSDGRKAVLIRLEYKLGAVYAMNGNLEKAIEHRDEAQRLEPEPSGSESSPPPGRKSTYDLTKRIAQAAIAWRSLDEEERRQGRQQLLERIAAAQSGLPRDDLLLLLYVGENLLESDQLAPQEKADLAKQMQQLIRSQPFPPRQPGAPDSPLRVPGVFERYNKAAEAILAAKE
ncbi:MAG: serine/threonine protein kinase [Planctomycetes bacterium]|nr:serine/threonine protein kinase [Planctomycetota bacterium]